jgi:hypothetical protein
MNDEILLKREAREAIEARIEPGCERTSGMSSTCGATAGRRSVVSSWRG